MMTMLNLISFLALVLSLAGNTLINFKKKIGFVVWISSNLAWIAVNFLGTPNWSQIAMFVAYMALNIHGWISWTKNEKKSSMN